MTPIASRLRINRGGHDGAIAQLGERVVRNDEVGGSIPPGSTTLRPSGFAWRSHVMAEGRSVVPGVAPLGEDGLVRHCWEHLSATSGRTDYVVRLHHPQHQFSGTGI